VKLITVHLANGGRINYELGDDALDELFESLLDPELRFLVLAQDWPAFTVVNLAHVMRIDVEPVTR
jgi:hypothetical protein